MLRVAVSFLCAVAAMASYAANDPSVACTDMSCVSPSRAQRAVEPTLPRLPGYADPAQRDGATAPTADASSPLDATLAASDSDNEPVHR